MTTDRNYKPSVYATAALHELQKDESLDRDLVIEFINAIGLHPVGSLVQLDSKRLAIVSQRNLAAPLEPIVMVIYSLENKMHTDVERVDLRQSDDNIVTGVRPEEFSMNLGTFFRNVFLPPAN
jgi:hypothetical protein